MHEFKISTSKRQEIIDITEKISSIVKKSGIKNGLCNVFTPHATAAIILNENADPNLEEDFFKALNKSVLQHDNYKHDKIDNNAAAHIASAIIGASKAIPIKNSGLLLGTWQNIMLCELDGPRERRVIITIIEENKI